MNYAETFAKLTPDEREQFDRMVEGQSFNLSEQIFIALTNCNVGLNNIYNLIRIGGRVDLPVRVRDAWREWYPQHKDDPMTEHLQSEMELAIIEADADERQTRWDRFAAAALTGLLADWDGMNLTLIVRDAKRTADMMIEEK